MSKIIKITDTFFVTEYDLTGVIREDGVVMLSTGRNGSLQTKEQFLQSPMVMIGSTNNFIGEVKKVFETAQEELNPPKPPAARF